MATALIPFICEHCNSEAERRGRRQLYCAPCALEIKRERHRVANAKYEASRPPRKRNEPIDVERRQRWAESNAAKRLASVRAYNDRNREEINRKSRLHLAKPDTKANRREIDRRYRAKPKQRVDGRMKASIQAALKGGKAGRSWETLVGYSLDELVRHLERQFVKGMTWDNIGDWEIDHIRPRSSFSYETAEDPEFRACWNMLNLRPLWSLENRSKHARLTHLL